ncbi:MAG: helix-turn-helix domain-containing protein [Lachnospiraceae bacterium]|nr:helix-turn-helix domain-containing protein [Lachnospiraceae bacterium]
MKMRSARCAGAMGTEEETVGNRPEYDAKLIGRNLKRLRIAKKLSVEEVRRYLGLGSVQAVYKYEAGKSYPPSDAIFALMQLYEADLYDILCGCDQRPCITFVQMTQKRHIRKMKKYVIIYRKYIGGKTG